VGDEGKNDEGKYGDRAGEHLTMQRGKWDAKAHVFLGFLIIVGFVGLVLLLTGALILEPPWTKSWLADRRWREALLLKVITPAGFGVGLVTAWLLFRDRWRCIERFASRYCSGLANLSMVYVPLIAAGYGVVRGFRKLRGR
jgi:uncharacterized membrane protein